MYEFYDDKPKNFAAAFGTSACGKGLEGFPSVLQIVWANVT